MEFRVDVRLPFAPRVVFAACRDDMPKLLAYLPRIRSIEVTSRKVNGSVVEVIAEWRGGADIPGPLRALLGHSMFAWTDYGTWDTDVLQVDWRTEPETLKGAVRCRGRDRFLEDGPGKTLLEIRGDVEVDAKRLPGVPSLFGRRAARMLEDFVVRKICSDMVQTETALGRYLAQPRA